MRVIKTGHQRKSKGLKSGFRGLGTKRVVNVFSTICFLIVLIASSAFHFSCSNKESKSEILTGATLTPEETKRLTDAHRPAFPFDKLPPPPAPDYAMESSWAALFPRADEADVAPPNTLYPEAQARAGIDVFFIHPTCYAKRNFWNGPIDDPDVKNSVSGILMFQASVFNASARVYAPRYRQFGLYAALERETTSGMQAFELAYSDIERAFDYYIKNYNQDRPFILAGHSQGSIHGSRLLQKKIIGTPLQSKLVAAYLIGMTIPNDLSGIEPSKSATDLGKVINWIV